MKKATATAPANIAFIKYWGRKDAGLRLPTNASISMNLSNTFTTTTVEFIEELEHDDVHLAEGEDFSPKENARVAAHLDRIRKLAQIKTFARVVTKNSFPKSTGAASSASGFAALTVAASTAVGLSLSEKELTILARIGSGSACRSIPDGFVKWEEGTSPETSFAHSLYPSNYWDICDLVVIVETKKKDVSSSSGQDAVTTSPLFAERLKKLPQRIAAIEEALKNKNFPRFGEIVQEDCLDMHAVMQTQVPPLLYWSDTTKQVIEAVKAWRNDGLAVYFTIDAGPNVHLICEGTNEKRVTEKLQSVSGIVSVIVNKPAIGAHIIGDHLF